MSVLTISGSSLGLGGGTAFAVSVGPRSSVALHNTPYSTAGQTCDPTRDGYHFIMNQLEYPAGSVISHPPCGTTTTTTSTTTTEATTTDESKSADATTTTAATTTTTTVLVLSEVPVPPSTTNMVASLAPTTTIEGSTLQLPRTGSESGRLTILGLALFGFGLTLVGLGRRRRQVTS